MPRESTNSSMVDNNAEPLVALAQVDKSFGPNLVLQGIDFELLPGEIHALVGENGAGKSTCLGLLYGLHQPSAGHLEIDSNRIKVESPAHAQSLGVGCVFQELSLAGSLSVAENIFAGRAPTKFGVVDWSRLHRQAEALLAELEISVDVTKPVDSLPISTRQMVEIAKAISLNSKILLLDEPTSALTPDEVDALFVMLEKLTNKGIGIVYVSHHMSEIFRISDRITVLRDGKKISTNATSDTSQEQVVTEMVGGNNLDNSASHVEHLGAEILRVEGLTHDPLFEDINFTLHKGEILGLAGLLGSRRSEIVRAIAGIEYGATGQIVLNGQTVAFRSIRDAMQAGIGFVPEERKTEGLFLNFPISENLVAASMEKHTSLGIVQSFSVTEASNRAIDAFSVRTQGSEETVGALSGGNQQKIMLAKWLEREPELLIIEEPTKGVDIGAKFQIHSELQKRAEAGMAIIVVSSDFPELVSVCSRILVVHGGHIAGEVAAKNATEDSLLQMAAGLNSSAGEKQSSQKGEKS